MRWQTNKLGELITLEYGKPLEKNLRKDNGRYPAYGANGVKARTDEFFYDRKTIIVGRKGSAGELTISEEKFWPLDVTYYIKFDEKMLDLIFLYRLLETLNLQALATGVKPGINRNVVYDIEVPVPPLAEQKQIVAILDEAFANIDHVRQLAERNLNNARDLFDSTLNQLFSQRGDGWIEQRFHEVCILQRGFDLPTRLRKSGSFPLLSANGVTDHIDRWKVTGPGVITGRSGTIGKVHFIETDFWPLNTALYIKDFHGNSEKFIYYFLRFFDLGKFVSGAGVPTLNRNNIHHETCWIPLDKNSQNEIVEKLEYLSHEVAELEKIYQKKITALDELKQSLLQKAFRGELTQGKAAA